MANGSWMGSINGELTTKDGRKYSSDSNGTLRRKSIVKMNAKQRKKLYAKMRAAAQVPESEPEAGRWMDSEERQRLLHEVRKDYE